MAEKELPVDCEDGDDAYSAIHDAHAISAANQADGSRKLPLDFPSKLGRVGVPDDIARAALFMTGNTLVVDVGESA